MAKRRRKTLVTCRPCHEDIHAGWAHHVHPKVLTGEPCDGKNCHAPFGKMTAEKNPRHGTSPTSDFTLRGWSNASSLLGQKTEYSSVDYRDWIESKVKKLNS